MQSLSDIQLPVVSAEQCTALSALHGLGGLHPFDPSLQLLDNGRSAITIDVMEGRGRGGKGTWWPAGETDDCVTDGDDWSYVVIAQLREGVVRACRLEQAFIWWSRALRLQSGRKARIGEGRIVRNVSGKNEAGTLWEEAYLSISLG